MKLQGTMKVEKNQLSIGGVGVETLKREYGTPLYIIDQEEVEDRCKLFNNNFKHVNLIGEVAYASKAFLTIGMAQIIAKEGLSIDVVSGGELYTVYKADFPMEKVYFHGNNKSVEELKLAIDLNCGNIVLDNRREVDLLGELLDQYNHSMNVFLRVNPGINADTHEYIKTTTDGSKFGESIYDKEIFEIIKKIKIHNKMNFRGLHCHIGSQILAVGPFYSAVEEMLEFYKIVKDKLGIEFETINLGGGFGVYYVHGDNPIDLGPFLKKLIGYLADKSREKGLKINRAIIEPGRAIINNAGSTLYTVGGTKRTYGGKEYIFIDGGMSDNIRPALYQAEYEACLGNRVNDPGDKVYSIGGKLCESGDVLIKDIDLPEAKAGDLLLISSTGAYNFSMSSNYNRVTRPAVVLVKDKEHRLMVKRQGYEDLVSLDVKL